MPEARTAASLASLLRLHRSGFAAIVLLGLLQSISEGLGIGLFVPLLNLLAVGAQPARPRSQWLADTMERLFHAVAPERRLAVVVLCVFAAVVTSGALAYLHGVLFAWLDGRIGHYLRSRIFAQLLSVNFGFIERDRAGRILHVLSTGTWHTSEALGRLVRMVIIGITIVVYVSLLLLMSWRLTLVVGGALLLISTAVRILTKRVREYGDGANRLNADLGHAMVESIDGMRVIRAFAREHYERTRFEGRSALVRQAFLRMRFLEEAVHPLHDVLAAALLLIIVFGTARSGGDVSALLIFVFVLYRLQPRVKEFDAARVRLTALSPAVEEVRALIDRTGRQYLTCGTRIQAGLETGIAFNRVSFRYGEQEEPALKGASFTLPARRTTALVGLSGGGKSTIIKLILRFGDPTAGKILVDGCPLAEFDIGWWRSQLALVGQDVYLFNASVRDNIAYGRLDAGMDEIVDAARQAGAHEFIERLPRGYDTLLGARGARLSGGQQQRISLARAIIRNPAVLILDEATNSLDSISEQWIQSTLERMRHRRTVIMIAHRLSTIEHADQIIVLDQGQVREQGTLSQLIAAEGLFAKLHHLQHGLVSVHDG